LRNRLILSPPARWEGGKAARPDFAPQVMGRSMSALAEIQPFVGIRYRATDLSRVLAPPYDVIPPAYRDELYARDPHNVVRLILNRTPGDRGYAEAGETYRRWLAEGVLEPDAAPDG
jgi:hypothetical protein